VKRVLGEALILALLGAALSFAANGLSPRGLKLARNYFPKVVALPPVSTNASPVVPGTNISLPNYPVKTNGAVISKTNAPSPIDLLRERLKPKGIGLVDSNQVVQLFHDPRLKSNLVVFVDARNDDHYQAGHVPGAYQLDYYRPENYLMDVLQACQIAQQIVIYCNGGTCEDSELAATLLMSAIPKEKLFVYGGGWTEWTTNSLPIEIGSRNSGNIRSAK
jgi:rhodanese-related sulfurtransferase